MKNWFEKLWETIRHYKWTTFGVALALVVLLWVYGCDTQLQSPISGENVTQAEWQLEVQTEAEKLEAQASKLELQAQQMNKKFEQADQIKQALFSALVLAAEGGTVNPVGVAVSIAGILGLGHYADNREKDRLLTGAKRLSVDT